MATPTSNANSIAALVKFDLDENAEVIGGQNYIGELPPANAKLPGIIKRVYLASTTGGDPMLKVRYEVSEGKYTGYGAWDNVTLNNAAKFKWAPFCVAMGAAFSDLITKTRVNPHEESEAGLRVVKIGEVDLTTDAGVPVYFGVEYGKFDGVRTTSVAAVLPRHVSNLSIDAKGKGEYVVPESADDKAAKKDGPF